MYGPQWHTLGRKTRQAKWQFFGSQKKNDATVVEKISPLLLLSFSLQLAILAKPQQLGVPLSLLLVTRIGRCVGCEDGQIG